ncbi:COP9 signalosome complex subunit 5 [Nymphaea thermarum]|nr:COP9 signalosome complex subunit 5 [Nymphaea thermarum]
MEHSAAIAQQTWELENSIVGMDVPDSDSIYFYDEAGQTKTQQEKPWNNDPHYFKKVKISALALLKMVVHARSGGTIEVMGLMQGKTDGDTIIVMDAFALPVEGTETRVNAQADAYEYMVDYSQTNKQVRPVNWSRLFVFLFELVISVSVSCLLQLDRLTMLTTITAIVTPVSIANSIAAIPSLFAASVIRNCIIRGSMNSNHVGLPGRTTIMLYHCVVSWVQQLDCGNDGLTTNGVFDPEPEAFKAGRLENVVGWYHSHPGYGCWLSGIDVSTQMLNQQFQEPFLAVVIDPTRTVSAGKVEIGAFRTYPQGYKPPDEPVSEYQTIPLNKIEDFGVHCKQYYALDITYFKSSLDSHLLDLLWNKYWVNTLSSSPLLGNRDYVAGQISDLGECFKPSCNFHGCNIDGSDNRVAKDIITYHRRNRQQENQAMWIQFGLNRPPKGPTQTLPLEAPLEFPPFRLKQRRKGQTRGRKVGAHCRPTIPSEGGRAFYVDRSSWESSNAVEVPASVVRWPPFCFFFRRRLCAVLIVSCAAAVVYSCAAAVVSSCAAAVAAWVIAGWIIAAWPVVDDVLAATSSSVAADVLAAPFVMAELLGSPKNAGLDAGSASKAENVPIQVTSIRLTKDNYLSWSAALEIGITSRGRLSYITGDKPAPLKSDPQWETWALEDSQVKVWIISSVSSDIQPLILRKPTSFDMWTVLAKMYGRKKRHLRTYQIKRSIYSLTQGDLSVAAFYAALKTKWEELDYHVTDEWKCGSNHSLHWEKEWMDRTFLFLGGLRDEFEPIRSQILNGDEIPGIEEVQGSVLLGVALTATSWVTLQTFCWDLHPEKRLVRGRPPSGRRSPSLPDSSQGTPFSGVKTTKLSPDQLKELQAYIGRLSTTPEESSTNEKGSQLEAMVRNENEMVSQMEGVTADARDHLFGQVHTLNLLWFHKFLAGLSPEYVAAKDQMLTGSEIPDLCDAYNRLSRLVISLSQPAGVTSASALAVGGGRGHGSIYSTRGRGIGRGTGGCGRRRGGGRNGDGNGGSGDGSGGGGVGGADGGAPVHRARPVDLKFVARGVLKGFVSAPQVLADPGQQVEQMASLTSYWGGKKYGHQTRQELYLLVYGFYPDCHSYSGGLFAKYSSRDR